MRVQEILQASTAAAGLAEESGYILVALLGYNTGGWHGSPALSTGREGGKGGPRRYGGSPASGESGRVEPERRDECHRQEILRKMKDVNRPVMIVKGDMDEAVPVTSTRMWVDTHEGDEAGNQPWSGDPGGTEGTELLP